MENAFARVKAYAAELGLVTSSEDVKEELIVVDNPDAGILNLVIDVEEPIVILEQLIFRLSQEGKASARILHRLLQMNRNLVHGAFVIDEGGDKVIFRDTLQSENLDLNELEGSIQALSLGLAEYGEELLSFSKI